MSESASCIDDPMHCDASQSRIIRMTPGNFLGEMIFRHAWIWILILSLSAVAGLALGIMVDIRWLVVALLVICIVAPGLLAFLYYFHGLKRGFYVNTIPHRIVITENGLAMRLRIPVSSQSMNEEEEPSGKPAFRYRDELFPFSALGRFVIGNKCAIVPLVAPESGFIWIPEDAFENRDDLAALLKLLDSRYETLFNTVSR